jgi:hypothetical protein
MPNIKRAEQILSLVMPSERAASIAGDLTEASPGGFRFWASLIRICFSMLWKDLSAVPGRTAYLMTAGVAVQAVFFLPLAVACYLLALTIGVMAAILGIDLAWVGVEAVFALLVLSAAVPAPYMAGRWIGRRAAGRELSPCLALTIFAVVFWTSAVAVLGDQVELMNGLAGILPTAACLFVAITSLWVGAIHTRTRAAQNSAWRWFERIPLDATPSWRITDPAQQRLFDGLLLLAPFALAPTVLLHPPSSSTLTAVLSWLLAAVMLSHAILSRPLQWVKPDRFTVFAGRALFAIVAVLIVVILLRW